MNIIHNKITSFFPDLNWKTLGYENNPRIRFYFDDIKRELFEVQKLSTNIIDDIFYWNPVFIAITFFSQNSEINKKIVESIKERWLINILSTKEFKLLEIEEEVAWYYYFIEIQSAEIEKINKAIIEADFAVDPLLQLHCYYFCPEKHLVINLYDDRGMDIISDKVEVLQDIQNEWSDKVTIKFENT